MPFMHALQTALHWILLLIEAGTLVWLLALGMAVLGWAAWGIGYLCRNVSRGTPRSKAASPAPSGGGREHRPVRAQRG